MTKPNICREQSCNEKVRKNHYLCREHWEKSQEGAIDECPECGVYKDSNYTLCVECNKKKKAESERKKKPGAREEKKTPRRYDPVRADTFEKRAALLEDDPKAEDKRLLFHEQQAKCVYCGNVYPYDELQIEHIIPKARGGPDHLRNSQLACRSCNQAKGTQTDIEFRRKHANVLPQKERTPAEPPINPDLLRTEHSSASWRTAEQGVGRKTRSGYGAGETRREEEASAFGLIGVILKGIKDHFFYDAYCVRCARSIEFDDEKPLCDDCFRYWSRYQNPDYEESYCHGCGKERSTTFAKPLCRPCYKKHFG